MTIDQAVKQYSVDSGNELYWVSFEANMTNLPQSSDGTMLVPCHCYLYQDHMKDKAAITHRNTSGGTYEVSGNYFTDMDGTETYITVPTDEFRMEYVGVTKDFSAQALAQDSNGGDIYRVGDALNPPKTSVKHLDFMSELQYSGSMPFGDIDTSENTIIVSWVGTKSGVERPADVLSFDGDQQGTYARITSGFDSWGRLWLGFGLEA